MGGERLIKRVYMSKVRGKGGEGGHLLGGWMEKCVDGGVVGLGPLLL